MIEYTISDSPDLSDDGKIHQHVKHVKSRRIDTDELCRIIEERSAVNKGDVKTVISTMSAYIREAIMDGKCVEIDGIGSLKLGLTGVMERNEEGDGETNRVKVHVRFRADKALRQEIQDVEMKAIKLKGGFARCEVPLLVAESIRQQVEEFGIFTKRKIQMMTGLSYYQIDKYVNPLVEKGEVENIGGKTHAVFIKRTK